MDITEEEKKEQIVKILTNKMCEFFHEEPRMLKAMVGGYKAQFWFEASETNPQELIIKSNVISPEGGEMTLKDFFEGSSKYN